MDLKNNEYYITFMKNKTNLLILLMDLFLLVFCITVKAYIAALFGALSIFLVFLGLYQVVKLQRIHKEHMNKMREMFKRVPVFSDDPPE